MALALGTRIGVFEVTGSLGAGGMGEVYRAKDTKLGRDVALKILPEQFATDTRRLARFQREAQLLASLNHSNIGAIYGFEETDGSHALVLELVEGDTLADRVRQGPIPIDEALTVATQISAAIEAAHQQGIIHRDLKPSNIKIKQDGTVKVLDFGLAKALDPGSSGPTSTTTEAGLILGSAAYMSPEQAGGQIVDKHTDLWAFGCVLYEMLTGHRAFRGETFSETVVAVLEREPDWSRLPANTSPHIRRLLHRCLTKDSRHRLHAAADVRIAIEDGSLAGQTDARTIPWKYRQSAVVGWLIALLAMLVTVTIAWSTARRSAPDLPSLRLDINTATTRDPISFALSPDGRSLVFVALEEQTPQLWLRHLDQADPQLLVGTEGASLPFWAPSSRSVAFFADGWLKRLDLASGRPQLLAQARNPMGGAWNHDDVILYSPNGASPLMHVPASGGTPTAITRLLPGEVSHRFPTFLPDGNRFLFVVLTNAPDEGLYRASLALDAPHVRLVPGIGSAADFAPSGHLLTAREGSLIAVPFDVRRGTVLGDPITLASHVVTDERRRGAFSVSASGLVAYRRGPATSSVRELAWIHRDGSTGLRLPGQGFPSLSMNGQQIAVSHQTLSRTLSNYDIWLIDPSRGAPRQFTFDGAFDVNPVWSPDGSRVVFGSNRKGVFDLFEKAVGVARDEKVLLETADNKFPLDWSPNGQVLLFMNEDSVTGDDLWTVSVQQPRKLIRLLSGAHAEGQGQFSPDGRWLAYRSNESGRWEVYVRPYPGPGSQQLVSRGGGIQPRWRRDGKELFYIAADSNLMAVPITLRSEADMIEVGAAGSLFTARLAYSTNQQFGYAVDREGHRFLMWSVADQANNTPITIVQSWTAVVKE